ncbi:MAG: DUF4363 family protein [Bacillota bacterium]|nr:DUF4363 family protein [Bacillota bacterium]
MSRLWVSTVILVGMVLLLGLNSHYLTKITASLAEELLLASEAAEAEDWEKAKECSQAVQEEWERHMPYLRLVQSHASINEIATLLDESMARLNSRDLGEYTATNARALRQISAICELERLSLGNLF